MYRKRFRVDGGRRFKLRRRDPGDTADVRDKDKARTGLIKGVERLETLQDRLYAQHTWAVLVILQGIDASGKDSTIKHVMSGVNPQGCQVYSFKAPSSEELEHDYFWRSVRALPERGRIGIHNRSYYEEVLVTRVHPELVVREGVPRPPRGKALWTQRYREINRFERYLVDNGTLVVKFFLHLSKGEQRRRFLDRLADPDKRWKFQPRDLVERARWKDYHDAYEEMLRHTSTSWAPWYVVPADHKWFTRLAVADILGEVLTRLDLRYPAVSAADRAAFQKAQRALERS
jgi:PPK2 family polyphosphate:nucleotide phosphotransferase